MHELDAILNAWRGLTGLNRNAVLATVVHVRGSAYRRPGARMLMVPDGRRIGSVSGGCLEGEIAQKAWWFTETGAPALRVYDTSSEDDAVWEFGLGCNGVVQVLLERVESPDTGPMLEFLDARRAADECAAIATVIAGPEGAGRRLFYDTGGLRGGRLAGSEAEAWLTPHIHAAIHERKSCLVHRGETQVFVEWIAPQQRLAIVGAGHDAVPLAAIAQQLGWRVTVADGRPAYAAPDRFPGARVVLMDARDPLRNVPLDRDSAVVLMTHNYPLDARLLPRILAAGPRYVGILGPKARTARLFEEIGIEVPPNVDAPVGLDIGCDTPAAVALSIVSGIQAALHGRDGGRLRVRDGSIHPPAEEVGAGTVSATRSRPAFCETRVGSNV